MYPSLNKRIKTLSANNLKIRAFLTRVQDIQQQRNDFMLVLNWITLKTNFEKNLAEQFFSPTIVQSDFGCSANEKPLYLYVHRAGLHVSLPDFSSHPPLQRRWDLKVWLFFTYHGAFTASDTIFWNVSMTVYLIFLA